jgi:hypothetical protein
MSDFKQKWLNHLYELKRLGWNLNNEEIAELDEHIASIERIITIADEKQK